MAQAKNTKKVAILGGGIGAMTAAFDLTNSKALREQHEVTIYQLGWRLGGKGASGRNPVDGAELIQEHGLHILMGCYENSFRMLRQCYKELNRPRGTPLRVCLPMNLGLLRSLRTLAVLNTMSILKHPCG